MRQMFLTSSSDCVMDDIVKKLPKKPQEYKVAFVNTAAEAEEGDRWWVTAEKNKLIEVGFEVEEMTVTGLTKVELENRFSGKDIIYFCGGNTFYLLDQVIKTGCDEIIRRKIGEGIIYIGSSAGSMIMGVGIDLVSEIDDKTKAPDLKSSGLGIVDMLILPHWGSDEFRKEYMRGFESMYRDDTKITLLSNSQYIWVDGEDIKLKQVF